MCKRILILLFFLCSFTLAQPIELDNTTSKQNILLNSQIYIDKSRTSTIQDIQHISFKPNNQTLLAFGYSPDFNVWVKFTLHNNTNKPIEKILEYANSLTTNIDLYELNANETKHYTEGILQKDQNRYTINPIFPIKLQPNESKTYYLKASSYKVTLIVKLNLYDPQTFQKNEIKHQFILALFFGAITILALYNLFIFFFTKDISYLYYVLYILSIAVHHLFYIGIAYLYILSPNTSETSIQLAPLVTGVPLIFLALFTKSFLNTKQYILINKILNLLLIILPILLLIFIISDSLNHYRGYFMIVYFLYIMFVTVYAAYKKNIQAYYLLAGWFMIFISIFLMFLSSIGVFNIFVYFPYIVETGLLLEALIFSIALVAKIKILQKEKTDAQRKLFENEKMAAMGEMIGNIAHQWRQPLSVISTVSSGLVLQKETNQLKDEDFFKSVDTITHMTKHLSQTIDDFRDYIKGDMKISQFNLDKTIEKVIRITSSSLQEYRIEVIYNLDDSIQLNSCENALIQSLLNIINNAKDAISVQNSKENYLFITTHTTNKEVSISIKDNAGGINESIINRIFEAYFTTKHEQQGTGLGLHMTYNLVTSTLHGEIQVQNTQYQYQNKSYKGAEFIITLPHT